MTLSSSIIAGSVLRGPRGPVGEKTLPPPVRGRRRRPAAACECQGLRDRTDFRMVYYNADGSRADMCGNGARCMAWFAHARGAVGKSFRFHDGCLSRRRHRQQIDRSSVPGRCRATIGPKSPVKVEGKTYRPAFINTGVPHAVLFVRDADKVCVGGLGRALRFHKAFGPKGTQR